MAIKRQILDYIFRKIVNQFIHW